MENERTIIVDSLQISLVLRGLSVAHGGIDESRAVFPQCSIHPASEPARRLSTDPLVRVPFLFLSLLRLIQAPDAKRRLTNNSINRSLHERH